MANLVVIKALKRIIEKMDRKKQKNSNFLVVRPSHLLIFPLLDCQYFIFLGFGMMMFYGTTIAVEKPSCFEDLDKCLEKVILPTVAATNSVYSPETCRTDRTLCTNYICYYAKHFKLLTECALDGNDQVDGIIDNTANSSFNSLPAATTSYSSSNSKKKHHHFFKELRCLMYGFGDDKQPYTESIELLDEIVVEFIKNFTLKALDVGKNGKIQLEDVWYLIRRDPKKYCRVKDLLTMNEELRKARKAFDETKY